jgi:hypothetical protein
VLLYDLTSTYVESTAKKNPTMRRGCSRDHRPNREQMVIALIVNSEGFPFSYEAFYRNRADVSTMKRFCACGAQVWQLAVTPRNQRSSLRKSCRHARRTLVLLHAVDRGRGSVPCAEKRAVHPAVVSSLEPSKPT